MQVRVDLTSRKLEDLFYKYIYILQVRADRLASPGVRIVERPKSLCHVKNKHLPFYVSVKSRRFLTRSAPQQSVDAISDSQPCM